MSDEVLERIMHDVALRLWAIPVECDASFDHGMTTIKLIPRRGGVLMTMRMYPGRVAPSKVDALVDELVTYWEEANPAPPAGTSEGETP